MQAYFLTTRPLCISEGHVLKVTECFHFFCKTWRCGVIKVIFILFLFWSVYITITFIIVWLSAVPLPPTAPVINDISATSCTVKYEPPDIQVGGPPLTGYFLEARTLNGRWIRVNSVPITGTEVKVVNLRRDMRYEFRLTAVDDNGCGEHSPASDAVVPFTENRPSQPGRPVATLSGTSVSLQWFMWAGANKAEQLRYVIHCREANTKRTVLYECTEQKAGTTIQHTLSGKTLKSDTEYEFAVAACNTTGLGRYSNYSSAVKTPAGNWLHKIKQNIFVPGFQSKDNSSHRPTRKSKNRNYDVSLKIVVYSVFITQARECTKMCITRHKIVTNYLLPGP